MRNGDIFREGKKITGGRIHASCNYRIEMVVNVLLVDHDDLVNPRLTAHCQVNGVGLLYA
jgi:hypothetical protein